MTPDQRHEHETIAIEHLEQAYAAMTAAAGDDAQKKLYAEELLDVLRRLRGDHSA